MSDGVQQVQRIAMWSGPRNLSTATMRSWENRPDTTVIDEPLYPWHLATTGMDHPVRDETVAIGPTNIDEAIARCLAPLPDGYTISFQKHMSAHLPGPEIDGWWLDQLTHGLLLRHPYRVLASYTRKWETMPLSETGLLQQVELLPRSVVVVDSDDFLVDPEAYTEAICDRFSVPFRSEMLSWPSGRRSTDGVWGKVWYESVEASTGFGSPPGPPPLLADLPESVHEVALQAMELYNQLRAHRMVL